MRLSTYLHMLREIAMSLVIDARPTILSPKLVAWLLLHFAMMIPVITLGVFSAWLIFRNPPPPWSATSGFSTTFGVNTLIISIILLYLVIKNTHSLHAEFRRLSASAGRCPICTYGLNNRLCTECDYATSDLRE